MPADPAPPAAVLRRGRRRQVGTVVVGAAFVAAVAVLALTDVAAPQAQRPATPAGPPRTSTVSGVTLTYPSTWVLQDLWMAQRVIAGPPLRAAFTLEPTPGLSPGAWGTGPPAGQVALTVRTSAGGFALGGAGLGRRPIPCAGGEHALWRVGDGFVSAFVGIGPGADPAEVRHMRSVLSGLRFASAPTRTAPGPAAIGVVLVSGTGPRGAWNLELRHPVGTGGPATLDLLDARTHAVVGTVARTDVGRAPLLVTDASANGTPLQFGVVRSGATAVRLTRPRGTVAGTATIVPLPGSAFDVFWRRGPMPGGTVTWTPTNARGQTLSGWELSRTPGTPIASGTYLGNPWVVTLAMRGGAPCAFASLDPASTCYTGGIRTTVPALDSIGTVASPGRWDHRFVIATVPTTVRTLIVRYRGRSWPVATVVPPAGFPRVRFAAFLLPGGARARVSFLTADGTRAFPSRTPG